MTSDLAIWMFPAAFLLIFAGIPVAFSLLIVAVLFALPVFGSLSGLQLYQFVGSVSSNYALAAVPLFIFMGAVLESSGIGKRAFDSLSMWMGRLPGGLAIATLAMCTLFAAGTGVVGAVEVMTGLLVMGPMRAAGYSKSIISGTICAGGSLGTMIPPSIVIVIYASVAQIPIGTLFGAVLLPGFLMVGLFLVWIVIYALIRPQSAPRVQYGDGLPLGKKLSFTAYALFPPLVLVSSVIGSILLGIAAVTEAAAIGAVGAVLLNILYRDFSWTETWRAAVKTAVVSSMIIFIALGGTMFTSIFKIQGGAQLVDTVISSLDLGPNGLILVLLLAYFVSGMILDWISAVLICTPIFLPFLNTAGADPMWFGVLAVVMLQTSYLTPPMAPAVFYLKGIAPSDFSTLTMYRGVLPFIFCQFLTAAAVFAFPELATIIPELMTP
mgnify:CR=1 FL=1